MTPALPSLTIAAINVVSTTATPESLPPRIRRASSRVSVDASIFISRGRGRQTTREIIADSQMTLLNENESIHATKMDLFLRPGRRGGPSHARVPLMSASVRFVAVLSCFWNRGHWLQAFARARLPLPTTRNLRFV